MNVENCKFFGVIKNYKNVGMNYKIGNKIYYPDGWPPGGLFLKDKNLYASRYNDPYLSR
ncbi:hypothetical protein MKX42_30435 [Paenibacillus sp. FSL R7-0204]|uniref:hypothetical protein n=1 Tax=Paenibacillus sp. FSL R7-0204 TaxID=2921675 RepID=UPI0030F73EB6